MVSIVRESGVKSSLPSAVRRRSGVKDCRPARVETGVKSGLLFKWSEFYMPRSISFDTNRKKLIIANNNGEELIIHDVD